MDWTRFSNPARRPVCPVGPDVVMHAPADQLADAQDPYPRAGAYVDGLQVGPEIKNVDSIEATLDDYFVVDGVREVPMSAFETTDPYDLFYASDDFRRAERLAEEIRSTGRIDPLIIVVDDEGPYVLEGGHRLAALHMLGKKSLPALVVLDAPEELPP